MPVSLQKKGSLPNNKHIDNLIGYTNNGIRILEFAFIKNNRSFWKCLCSCKKEFICLGKHIKNGNTKSCGCRQKDIIGRLNRLPRGESAFNKVIHTYKISAKNRGLEFSLTKYLFREITQKDCFYCGSKPSRVSYIKNGHGIYLYNGIDRVDNKIGYIESNVVPCCYICNTMKLELSIDDFFSVIRRIYERHIEKCQ